MSRQLQRLLLVGGLAAASCAPAPAPPVAPALVTLHELREMPFAGRPTGLFDTERGLIVTEHTDLGERVWLSGDGGVSWSEPVLVAGYMQRIWAVHEGCPELHRLEPHDGSLFHVGGLLADAPRARVTEPGRSVDQGDFEIRSSGEMGALWIDRDSGWPELMFSLSLDHGASWSPAVRVNTESRRKELNLPLLLHPEQGWVVVWTENRDARTLFDLYGTFSRDGRHWSPSRRLNDDQEASFTVTPAAVTRGSAVHVVIQDYRDLNSFGDRDANIYYARMGLERGPGPPNVRINEVAEGPQHGPSLAWDEGSGTLVATWVDTRHRLTGDLYAASSADGGVTWSPNRRVNVNARPERMSAAVLATARAGGVLTVWQQLYGGVTRTWMRRIGGGGAEPPGVPAETPIPAASAGPLITALPALEALDVSRFDDGSLGGWQPIDESWIVHDGALLGFGYSRAFARSTAPPLRDFVLEGRFRLDRREHLGANLLFRVDSEGDDPTVLRGYELRNHFRRGALLSRLRFTADGEPTPIFEVEPLGDRWFPFLQDRWYEFKLAVRGPRLDYWIGGEWLFSYEALEGGAGSILLGTDPVAPVEWDDLRLYSLEASE